MKFGKTLKKHSLPGWRYINYKFLKQVIRLIHPSRSDWAETHFRKMLFEEIAVVNQFFLGREQKLKDLTKVYQAGVRNASAYKQLCSKTKELREYMIINYIAVLKIVKKYDKSSPNQLREDILKFLLEQPFYKALKTSMLLTQTEKFLKECNHEDASQVSVTLMIPFSQVEPCVFIQKQCTICIDSCVTPVSLACGHEFCWACLAGAVLSNHKTCPLCRSEQSLNPVDLNISSILGAVDAHKYFPSNVDPNEIRKRALEAQVRTQPKKKRAKCTSGSSNAVDLTCWVDNKTQKPAGNCNWIRVKSSPFCMEGEIHIELSNTAKLPNRKAVVLEKAFSLTTPIHDKKSDIVPKKSIPFVESTQKTIQYKALPKIPSTEIGHLHHLNSSWCSSVASSAESHVNSYEEWFNDFIEGIDTQNHGSVFSVDPIKV
ncbi:hypothetical protein AAMO2058_001273500 [Amorphochlora amoebiformis]